MPKESNNKMETDESDVTNKTREDGYPHEKST